MNGICHVVASSSTCRVVLGAFEHDIEVWDAIARRMVAAFSTVFDFGGSRLALSDQFDIVLAGAYHRYGVVAYRRESGDLLWQRSDLKKVQHLTLSADGSRLFCGREGSPCEVVDVQSGKTLARLRGSELIWESHWDPIRLNCARRPAVESSSGEKRLPLPQLTAPILDATFARGKVFISEVAGPVICFLTDTGEEQWRYEPGPGAHVLHLAYRPDANAVVAVERTYETHDPYRLVFLSAVDGARRAQHEVDGVAHAFCDQGRCVVTSSGAVLASDSGLMLGVLSAATTG